MIKVLLAVIVLGMVLGAVIALSTLDIPHGQPLTPIVTPPPQVSYGDRGEEP